ncbi:MAG: hypothetical protein WBC34_09530 [Thiofilum sp.]
MNEDVITGVEEFYKIRREDGKYSLGGQDGQDFSVKGKVWKLLAHVKSAVLQKLPNDFYELRMNGPYYRYKKHWVLEKRVRYYAYVETVEEQTLEEFLHEVNETVVGIKMGEERRRREAKEEEERRMYLMLKAKFEG